MITTLTHTRNVASHSMIRCKLEPLIGDKTRSKIHPCLYKASGQTTSTSTSGPHHTRPFPLYILLLALYNQPSYPPHQAHISPLAIAQYLARACSNLTWTSAYYSPLPVYPTGGLEPVAPARLPPVSSPLRLSPHQVSVHPPRAQQDRRSYQGTTKIILRYKAHVTNELLELLGQSLIKSNVGPEHVPIPPPPNFDFARTKLLPLGPPASV